MKLWCVWVVACVCVCVFMCEGRGVCTHPHSQARRWSSSLYRLGCTSLLPLLCELHCVQLPMKYLCFRKISISAFVVYAIWHSTIISRLSTATSKETFVICFSYSYSCLDLEHEWVLQQTLWKEKPNNEKDAVADIRVGCCGTCGWHKRGMLWLT